jgi:hypothetical protein
MMFPEALVEAMGRVLTRRQFLVRLGGAVLAWVTVRWAPFASAEASFRAGYYVYCCNLCKPPSSPCPIPYCTQSPLPQTAKWCWYCQHSDGLCYKCCECKNAGAQCAMDCTNVYASYAEYAGRYCQGASSPGR